MAGTILTAGNVDLDPGPGVANINSTIKIGLYLQMLDANGKFVISKTYNEGANDPVKLEIDRDDYLYAMARNSGPLSNYSVYFQVDKTGKANNSTSIVNFALDSFGIVYKETEAVGGRKFGKFTRGGAAVYNLASNGYVLMNCDRQGNLYTVRNGLQTGTYILEAPAWSVDLTLSGSAQHLLVPDSAGGALLASTQDFNEVSIAKYKTCN